MNLSEDKVRVDINIKDGPIYGFVDNRDEKLYYTFKNIPFAKPPVGPLRFMPPSPATPWIDKRNCMEDCEPPLYFDKLQNKLRGSEDCLYIEVISPNIQPAKPLPVMFWIGSFGYSKFYDHILDASTLINEGIVFVRCGFRLGPFGFLSTNDFAAPGNNGLKDVVMALNWVQNNIHSFGGDKNNVTLFGNSTGGAIVHFMMLSPMAIGLFHKAIVQSVCALNNWSLTRNPRHTTIELAELLGITKDYEVVEELRKMPAQKIMEAFVQMEDANDNDAAGNIFETVFKPCIEQEFEGQPMFLTKSPYLILKSGNYIKVPLIIGCNNTEAAVLSFHKKDFYNFDLYNKNAHLLVPKYLTGETKVLKDIGHQLIKFYLDGDENFTENTKNQFLQLISDYYFIFYIHKTLRLHKQSAPQVPVYYYIMNYCGDWEVPKDLNSFNSLGHCAEIPLLFGVRTPNQTIAKGSRDSIKTRNKVVKMWTNFAKFGNPTPIDNDLLLNVTWDPVENCDQINYLSIGSELTKGKNPFQERMAFWNSLHQQNTFLRGVAYFNNLRVKI